jgi:hypothetical protein
MNMNLQVTWNKVLNERGGIYDFFWDKYLMDEKQIN